MGERSGAPSGFSPASIVMSKPPVAVQLPQPDVSANRDAPHSRIARATAPATSPVCWRPRPHLRQHSNWTTCRGPVSSAAGPIQLVLLRAAQPPRTVESYARQRLVRNAMRSFFSCSVKPMLKRSS